MVWIIILGSLGGIYLFYKGWFLRYPKDVLKKDGAILSPADGKIIKIIEYKQGRPVNIFKKRRFFAVFPEDVSSEGYILVILMNIFNIHWQKSPLEGRILAVRYKKGRFFNAVWGSQNMKATAENERNEILIETKQGRMKIIQIAGILARRIECFVKQGQKVAQGDDLGLIKLGSQVVLVLPKVRLRVQEGDKVKVGRTIIA